MERVRKPLLYPLSYGDNSKINYLRGEFRDVSDCRQKLTPSEVRS
jgi:hypothetical protein